MIALQAETAIQATILLGWALVVIAGVIVVVRFLSWLDDSHPALALGIVLIGVLTTMWYIIYQILLGA